MNERALYIEISKRSCSTFEVDLYMSESGRYTWWALSVSSSLPPFRFCLFSYKIQLRSIDNAINYTLITNTIAHRQEVALWRHCPWMIPHHYDWFYKAPAIIVLVINVMILCTIMWVSIIWQYISKYFLHLPSVIWRVNFLSIYSIV
jgi:hypothetical protein